VKRTGSRRAKLDQHAFNGIFIGYTATDANVRYIDVHSGIVKTSHHAVFDKCWFHHPWRPPAAQLLYDLGKEVTKDLPPPPTTPTTIGTPQQSNPSAHESSPIIWPTTFTPDPLPDPNAHPITQDSMDDASSHDDSSTSSASSYSPFECRTLTTSTPPSNPDASAVDHYDITRRDIAQPHKSWYRDWHYT
jgi:hypothetical protein